MRDSNRLPRGRRRPLALLVIACALATACGSGPPSAPPRAATPVPTPSPSPAPVHLTDPAAVDAIFHALDKAGLKVKANNAGSGGAGHEPIRRISATYLDWPLVVSEYSSSKALAKAKHWKEGAKPAEGEPPIAFIGLNILIEWGPTTTGVRPKKPEGRELEALDSLVVILDPLLSPLKVRTIVPVAIPDQPQAIANKESPSP
jgi:hypothetical protein